MKKKSSSRAINFEKLYESRFTLTMLRFTVIAEMKLYGSDKKNDYRITRIIIFKRIRARNVISTRVQYYFY